MLQIEREDASRLIERHLEREQGHRDASEDLPDLSEGEKDKENPNSASNLRDSMSRINSDVRIWSDDDETRRLYIVLIRSGGPALRPLRKSPYGSLTVGSASCDAVCTGWCAATTWSWGETPIRADRWAAFLMNDPD